MFQKIRKTGGATIRIPAPPRDSSRWLSCGACPEHVSLDDFSVKCGTCHVWCHLKCLKNEDGERDRVGVMAKKDPAFIWTCPNCRETQQK